MMKTHNLKILFPRNEWLTVKTDTMVQIRNIKSFETTQSGRQVIGMVKKIGK